MTEPKYKQFLSRRQRAKIPTGMRDTGQAVTLPEPVFDELLAQDPKMTLVVPIIPLYEPRKWADERLWCAYARHKQASAKATCEMLQEDESGHYCALNSPLLPHRTPCAFDEPEEAEIWRQINAYIEKCKKNGWEL